MALRITGVIGSILTSLLAMLEAAMLWRTVRIHPVWWTIARRGVTVLWCRRRITTLLAIALRLVMVTLSRVGGRGRIIVGILIVRIRHVDEGK